MDGNLYTDHSLLCAVSCAQKNFKYINIEGFQAGGECYKPYSLWSFVLLKLLCTLSSCGPTTFLKKKWADKNVDMLVWVALNYCCALTNILCPGFCHLGYILALRTLRETPVVLLGAETKKIINKTETKLLYYRTF